MRRSKDYPYWATPTQRAWKARKRAELAAIRRAVDVFRLGSAYVPCRKRGYTAIHLSSAFVREQSWKCDSTGCPYWKAATR